MKFYSRARENRIPIDDPSLRIPKRAFAKAAGANFLYLQILFLGLFAYIFGALYQQGGHTHNLKILYVDYDHGNVGTSIRDAYKNLKSGSFPTLIEQPSSEFPSPADLREEVCSTRYWATIYTSQGASDRIEAALKAGTADYDKGDIVTYVWNQVLYSAVADAAISGNLQLLSSQARILYGAGNWTGAIQNATTTTFATFANPWQLKSINIQPTTQGSRQIYNTLVIILILLQEFFYLGTLNGLSEAFKINSKFQAHWIILFRNIVSLVYTFSGSLCVTGAIWAFRSGWHVNAAQFFLTWAVLWLFAHVNFLTLDVFTIWLPHPFVPMALISWVILNVTSILLPFALSPAFYRWAYVLPAHEVFQVLLDIWSGGCNPKLHYALPVLFSLEISGLILSGLGVYRRAHYAVIKDEAEQIAFQGRLDAALKSLQPSGEERRLSSAARAASRASGEINTSDDMMEKEIGGDELRRLATVIQDDQRRIQREMSRTTTFGPSFGFAFGGSDSNTQSGAAS